MAAPLIRDSKATNSGGVAVSSLTGTLPIHQAGDILLLTATWKDATPTLSISTGQGWNLIRSDNNGQGAAREQTTTSWWKVCPTAAEPAPVVSSTASLPANLSCASISGADTTAPIDAHGMGRSGAAATSIDAPSITTSVADCLLTFVNGARRDRTQTPPTGMTEVLEDTNGTAGPTVYVATQSLAASGATGTRSSTPSSGTEYVVHLIAVKPSSAQAVAASLLTLTGSPRPASPVASPASTPAALLPLTVPPVSASLSAPAAVPAGRLDLSTVPLVSTPAPGPAVAPANLLALTPALQPATSAGSPTSATAPLLVLGTAPLASAPVGSAPNIAATLQVVTVAILPAGASTSDLPPPQSVVAGLIMLGLAPLSAGAAGAPLSAPAGLLSLGTAPRPATAAGAATAASAGLLSLGAAPLAGAPAGAPIATDTGFVSVLLGILAASATVEGAPAQPQSVVAGLLEIRLGLARIEERILLAIRTTTRQPSTRATSQRPLARSASREPSPRAISSGPSARSSSREPFATKTEVTT